MFWLPEAKEFSAQLRALKSLRSATDQLAVLRSLASQRLDFLQSSQLDRAFCKAIAAHGILPGLEPLRLAILSSSTTAHLLPGIRLAGLRRGLQIEIFEADYGQYQQELLGGERLTAFRPEVVLLAFDARHVAALAAGDALAAVAVMERCWEQIRERFGAHVVQQSVLPVLPRLLGSNETRLERSPAAILRRVNEQLRVLSENACLDLLAIDDLAAEQGLSAWHDATLWHKSKQEIHPAAAAMYGEYLVRVLAASRGRSSKCLVLDLDNTLWGGVIGDDGLEGIVLGQGSASGEAFVEFQRYAKALSQRGVVLAVCSKNDEANALLPFQQHPEMVLQREQIACFTANWTDKATNLRAIAKTLNLGLDALVFVDDNPVERALVRRELPMVAVPEMPEDPAEYVRVLSAAGYFEATRLSAEDATRTQQYQANAERAQMLEQATDMESYLRSLEMVLTAAPVDALSLQRTTQLVNKTNQFNLMTERLCEEDVEQRMLSPEWITLQLRLADRFGDNGLISVLMARIEGKDAVVESWLMSCRVLGRRVEQAALALLADAARARGVQRLVGLYKPTAKNAMVRDLLPQLGFAAEPQDGVEAQRFVLPLNDFQASEHFMQVLAPALEPEPAHV